MKTQSTLLWSLVLSSSIGGCHKAEPAAPARQAEGPPSVELTEEGLRNAEVRTLRVRRDAFAPRVTVPATLEPDPGHVARIGARVTGRIASIDVRLGDRVNRGQPLVQVETIELHQISSEFLTALARTREANDALDRQKQLIKERVGALQDLRRAEADAEVASVTFREANEHLHFLGLSAGGLAAVRAGQGRAGERSVVRSPIAGKVAALSASLGQVLGGTEDIITILDSSSLWATLRVYERDLAGVAPGAPVELRVPSSPDRIFKAVIKVIGELVDPVTHTVEARARLLDAGAGLKPGMTATASITLAASDSTLWLPADAVQPRAGDRVVFVRVSERRFEARAVAAGPERGGYVPVTAGLVEGTEVVVHGAFALRGELDRAELQGD